MYIHILSSTQSVQSVKCYVRMLMCMSVGTEQPNSVLSPKEDYFFLLQHRTVSLCSFCGAEFSQAFPNLLWHVACLLVFFLFSSHVGSRDGET